MATKQVTSEDLLNMKIAITKEQQEARHGQNNFLEKMAFDIDSVKIDHKLLEQSVSSMKDDLKDIKQILKETNSKIDSMEGKYADKEKIRELNEKIEKLEVKQERLEERNGSLSFKIAAFSGTVTITILGFIATQAWDKIFR